MPNSARFSMNPIPNRSHGISSPFFALLTAWLLIPDGSGRAQNSLNVTNFGARGDAVSFFVNTVSNSTVVSVAGTNRFSSADIGKVIEVFGAGPWLYQSNNPAYQLLVTNQDTICVITNVTGGTNLWGSIPQGWTTNAYCIVGTNNAMAFQNAINAAEALVGPGNQKVTINIPAGRFLIIGPKAMNPGYVMQNIADTDGALTITSGGITFLGASPTNTILMGCGAGMEHTLRNGNNPTNSWPYGISGAYVPVRGAMIFCSGPITNSQYPLVFQNLTFDGGLTNGLQPYNYYILYEGNGEGWDTTHDALIDFATSGTAQMNQLKVFTNCVFQHWRGEMLKSVTGTGGTNTFNDIANCMFFDGNASANNLYYGQHVHGCTFTQLVKVQEFYQANSLLPTLFENNFWSNIVSNPFSIVGATTNANPQSFTISNNIMYGVPNANQITFSPAENVYVVNNTFHGQASGVVCSAAGLQPSDGSASIISNIVVSGNAFNDTFLPIEMDGYPVMNMVISNNTSSGSYAFAMGAGWKSNIVFQANAVRGNLDSTGITNEWFFDDPSDKVGHVVDDDWAGTNRLLTYAYGRVHQINHAFSNSVYHLDDSTPLRIPPAATMVVSYVGGPTVPLYTSASPSGMPLALTNSNTVTFAWLNSAWKPLTLTNAAGTTWVWTNSVWLPASELVPVPSAPTGLHVLPPTNGL